MIDRLVRNALGAGLTTLFLASQVFCQTTAADGGTKWAVVNGEPVTEEQVKKIAADDSKNLDLRNAQADANFKRDEQGIYERTLRNIVDNKLLDAEAKKRSISVEELLRAEVESKATPPTDKEVNELYEANKARFNGASADLM